MSSYSLIEYKLRRFFYLGHEHSIYVPPPIRQKFWTKIHYECYIGVKLIGKIVKKNKPDEIDSIVPIILKVHKEGKLYNEEHLILSLAICAKSSINKSCVKMVKAAYDAFPLICTDGMKFLMFTYFSKVAIDILYEQGFLSKKLSGFGRGFRKALIKWYLNEDPLKTIEKITINQKFEGWTHKDLMKLIHIHSSNPNHQIYIIYTLHGMEKVEEIFKPKLIAVANESDCEKRERNELTFIYNYLKQIHNLQYLNVENLYKDIKLNKLGGQLINTEAMLNDNEIISSLIMHMPLRSLLECTFNLSKRKLFINRPPHDVLWHYILRFNDIKDLEKEQIHPIESFIQYARYSRTGPNIVQLQNNLTKKQENGSTSIPENKLKVIVQSKQRENNQAAPSKQGSVSNSRSNSKSSVDKKIELKSSKSDKKKPTVESIMSKENQTNQIGTITLLKPPPQVLQPIVELLSKDLINRTLELLQPTRSRILIAYDCRPYIKLKRCAYTRLIHIHEAITLITLSLIGHEKSLNKKPFITCLDDIGKINDPVEIPEDKYLTYEDLKSILYKPPVEPLDTDNKDTTVKPVHPMTVIDGAKEKNMEYDVFVFLGTNNMHLLNIKKSMSEYSKFLKKPVKVIVCCLNGKHSQQSNLGRGNMLYIVGFDKYVGKIIASFINGEF
ncbi:uncharacterized protein LOC126835217 [Adelges cooleyi]|uniref:uncharacterized protein LOC126835217 n=1 Tax=Adelges cooleyi TaxID=133065 RepID=UPI00217FE080|nr:uncharacterized protein LOC126835217 [Adelges cooleyi]XP_050423593.1 uncharacterized protein LOC126835217 [Adelges cooleyi]XP_050423594.1 uncharacterized protein LOC126835217 [Adelges cooleyi]